MVMLLPSHLLAAKECHMWMLFQLTTTVAVQESSAGLIKSSEFLGCSASVSGGAVYQQTCLDTTILETHFEGNWVTMGKPLVLFSKNVCPAHVVDVRSCNGVVAGLSLSAF